LKLAVVLYNLGGPDSPEAVEPFLRNLFSDPAIISLPGILRRPLARFVARRRAPIAREIYAKLGGRSPILEETQAQATALEHELAARGHEARAFIAMRCWKPFTDDAAREVAAWKPDRIVRLPLYPQFSTTTTGSSEDAWLAASIAAAIVAPQSRVCCYPWVEGFVAAEVALIREAYQKAKPGHSYRLLLSAHGLPERTVAKGDPYRWQVERSAAAIVEARDARPRLVRLLPKPGGPAEMDRTSHRYGDTPCRRGGQSLDRGADRLCVGAFRDAGRARYRVWQAGAGKRRARLFARTDSGDKGGIHGGACRSGGACRGDHASGHLRSGSHLSDQFGPLRLWGGKSVTDILHSQSFYLWVKAFHIIAVIAWMAGLLYLPRLFVYHCETAPGTPESERFKVMERKLMRGIINPSMIAVWILGLTLSFITGAWHEGWFHAKFGLVIVMSAIHGFDAMTLKRLHGTPTPVRPVSIGSGTRFPRR
jgi:ferrochelatase